MLAQIFTTALTIIITDTTSENRLLATLSYLSLKCQNKKPANTSLDRISGPVRNSTHFSGPVGQTLLAIWTGNSQRNCSILGSCLCSLIGRRTVPDMTWLLNLRLLVSLAISTSHSQMDSLPPPDTKCYISLTGIMDKTKCKHAQAGTRDCISLKV